MMGGGGGKEGGSYLAIWRRRRGGRQGHRRQRKRGGARFDEAFLPFLETQLRTMRRSEILFGRGWLTLRSICHLVSAKPPMMGI